MLRGRLHGSRVAKGLLIVGVVWVNLHRYHAIFVVEVAVICVCDHGAAGLVGPLLPLLHRSIFWAGVDPV